MTDVSRFSAWVLAAAAVLVFAACSKDNPPPPTGGSDTGPLAVETIILDPKVAAPGDTLLLTAVITSSSENLGDYPVMEWSATGGTFLETNKQSVRWVAPAQPGFFTVNAKATNHVNSATNKTSVYVGSDGRLVDANAGEVDLIGTGPNFRFLRTPDIVLGAVDVWSYIDGVASDAVPNAVPPAPTNHLNVAFAPGAMMEAHAADSLQGGTTSLPRNIYIEDYVAGTLKRITIDGAKPFTPNRNKYDYPSFSPNGQVIAYQRWAQSWDGIAPDSFHVYIQDLVLQKRTLVTYAYPFPRGFFPTFSTDSKFLVYILDRQHNNQWELYSSPMTGNTVDGSPASLKRLTNTGGLITTGLPKVLPKPTMAWNPVLPILAVSAADNALYLVEPNSGGSNVITVTGVVKAPELAWAPDGSMLATTYGVSPETGSAYVKLVTVSAAGVVTDRVIALPGDLISDMTFSPDAKWLLYRVTRGGTSWFSLADIGAGKLTTPVAVSPADLIGSASTYRGFMSLAPAWTSSNLMIYAAWGFGAATPGIFVRDLSGVVN